MDRILLPVNRFTAKFSYFSLTAELSPYIPSTDCRTSRDGMEMENVAGRMGMEWKFCEEEWRSVYNSRSRAGLESRHRLPSRLHRLLTVV